MGMGQNAGHWDSIYARKRADELSWYRPHLERSFAFLEKHAVAKSATIIDVGAGTSTFVDDLLERGYGHLTVLDISAAALEAAQQRLGERGRCVKWITGDITRVELPLAAFDFWHDRAVFHFLREAEDRRRYVAAVARAMRPGGHVVVATFGPGGPTHCSGLDVMRYSAEELHSQFGLAFEKVESLTEAHRTPWGSEQEFVYCFCRLSTPKGQQP
jgi:SAM-dependent methyltransferase